MTEIIKTIHDENPPFMEIFVMEESYYNSRSRFRLSIPRASTRKYGLETISFRGIQICYALPNGVKELEYVSSFKRKIKTWNAN